MTDRQGRLGSYLVSEPDTRGLRSSTHRPCFTSPLAKFDGSLIASGCTELVEQGQAISSKHEKHYKSTPCAGHVSCERGHWSMQYLRSSTEAVGGNSQSDHLFRLAQIAEVLGTPEYRSGAMRF